MADPSSHLLDLPARRGRLHALAEAGILDPQALERGLAELGHRPTRASWSAYLYWHALIIGVVLVVVGMIFFVAANWSGLSGVAKMSIVGGMMVAATLLGGYLGDSLAGRAASLLGGLLFGPLLAVYGQVYQTGADAWELFAWWSVVLVAYGLVTRFIGTHLLALICVHVAYMAWIDQELGHDFFDGEGARLVSLLALADGVFVGLCERFFAPDRPRERRVLTHAAAYFGLSMLLPMGVAAIVDEPLEGSELGLLVLALGLTGIWLVYRRLRPEIGMLAAFAMMVTTLMTCFCGRVIFEGLDLELFGVALLGLIVCVQVWLFTRWLLAWRRELSGGQS